MSVAFAFVAAAAVTFALRSSMTLLGAERSASAQSVIAFVTPAVLGAMVAGGVLLDHGQLRAPVPAELAAVGVALVVARRTGNVSLALAAGLPAFWAASALL